MAPAAQPHRDSAQLKANSLRFFGHICCPAFSRAEQEIY
jgi:hypothetical protein